MPHLTFTVDGAERSVAADTRTSLLDLLREQLGVIAVKKGCDHGQCGSCTVLLDGRRHLTCLALAVQYDGADIVTAAGLAPQTGDEGRDETGAQAGAESGAPGRARLHPMQRAFLDHDGFQCGYCTPGQICSAVGMLDEVKNGHPSHVTDDLEAGIELTDEEIRERLSGNLCRCGAYVNIVAAVRDAATHDGDDRLVEA